MQQDSTMQEHFKKFLNLENNALGVSNFLNLESLKWFTFKGNTSAYEVFCSQMNNLQLTINLFENLMLLQDLKSEANGVYDFTIDIPNWFFRFPSHNDPRQVHRIPFDAILKLYPENPLPEITDQEELDINRVIKNSKDFFKMGKDESIVREMMYRLEFLSMFGFFEVYLIDLVSNSINGGSENARIKARKESIILSLDEYLIKVLNEIDPQLIEFIKKIHSGVFKYLHYCYLARNIHIHNLGCFNNLTIRKGLEKKTFIEIPQKSDEEGNNVESHYILNISGFGDREFSTGDHLSLGLIVANFRGLIMIISEVIEFNLKQKSELSKNCEEVSKN